MSSVLPLVGEKNGSRVYRIGVVGFDTGDDDGGVFTGVLRTDPFSPAGEGGLLLYRRVAIRLLRSGSYTFTVKVFVDGNQTRIWNSSSVEVDQTTSFTATATALQEEVLEVDIEAHGTSIAVEIEIDSDNTSGVFLVESIFVHAYGMREALSRGAESQ